MVDAFSVPTKLFVVVTRFRIQENVIEQSPAWTTVLIVPSFSIWSWEMGVGE